MMMGTFSEMPDDRKSFWYHHPWFAELIQLFYLDVAGTTPANFDLYKQIIADYEQFLDAHPLPKKPLLTGTQVMDLLGMQPGEKIGEILAKLKEVQEKGIVTTKAEAKAFVEKMK